MCCCHRCCSALPRRFYAQRDREASALATTVDALLQVMPPPPELEQITQQLQLPESRSAAAASSSLPEPGLGALQVGARPGDAFALRMVQVSSRMPYLLNGVRFAMACTRKLQQLASELATFQRACEQILESRCLPHMLKTILAVAAETGIMRLGSLVDVCKITAGTSAAVGGDVGGDAGWGGKERERRVLQATLEVLKRTMPVVPDALLGELCSVRDARRIAPLAQIRKELLGLARGVKQVEKELRHLRLQHQHETSMSIQQQQLSDLARRAGSSSDDLLSGLAGEENHSARLAIADALASFCEETEPQMERVAQSLEAAHAIGEQLVEYFGAEQQLDAAVASVAATDASAHGGSGSSIGSSRPEVCVALVGSFIVGWEEFVS